MKYSEKKIFKNFILNFDNPTIQKLYNNKEQPIKYQQMKVVLQCLIAAYFSIFVKNIINVYNQMLHPDTLFSTQFYVSSLVMIAVTVCFICALYMIRSWIVFIQRTYILVFYAYLIYTFFSWTQMQERLIMEAEKEERSIQATAMLYMVLFYGLVQIVSFLESSWYARCLVLITQYCIMIVISVMQEIKITFSVMALVVCLLMGYIYYINEKVNKEKFFEVCLSYQAQQDWKQILDQIMPLPICMFTEYQHNDVSKQSQTLIQQNESATERKVKLSFANQNLKQLIQDTDMAKIANALDSIYVTNNNYQLIGDKPVNLKHHIEKLNSRDNTNLNSMSLLHQRSQTVSQPQYPNGYNLFNRDVGVTEIYAIYKDQLADICFRIKIVQYTQFQECQFMCVFEDQTQILRQNQQLTEMDEYKDKLLANVTHELKTPLNVIKIYSELSLSNSKEKNDHIMTGYLINIHRSQDLLLNYVQDILDYSKSKQGKLQMNKTQFSLIELLSELNQLFEIQTKMKNIELIFETQSIPSKYLEKIFSDKKRLKQVLINFLSNSLKFTEKGTISVKFEIIKLHQKVLQITVSDTGAGMHKNVKDSLFKQFHSFRGIHNENMEGTGLGLTICSELVKMLGPESKIEVESELNQGSSFRFQIYILENTSEQIGGSEEVSEEVSEEQRQMEKYCANIHKNGNQSQREIKGGENGRESNNLPQNNKLFVNKIMIVDDNMLNILALKELIIQNVNANILNIASNGKKAIQLIEEMIQKDEQPYDIIFMDVEMPIINGLSANKQILVKIQNLPKYSTHINIISCSASEGEAVQKQCKESGAKDYLVKPIDKTRLLAIIQEFGHV